MKNFLLISITLLALFSSGCTQQTLSQSNSDMKKCPFEVLALRFNYPREWGVCGTESNENPLITRIYFKNNYITYDTSLYADISDVPEKEALREDFGLFIPNQDTKEVYRNDYKVIYSSFYPGFFRAYGMKINDKYYAMTWDVTSNQDPPESPGGIWRPDHEFSDTDIVNILKSVERIGK